MKTYIFKELSQRFIDYVADRDYQFTTVKVQKLDLKQLYGQCFGAGQI